METDYHLQVARSRIAGTYRRTYCLLAQDFVDPSAVIAVPSVPVLAVEELMVTVARNDMQAV
jgi:hypothetical protein